MLAVGSDCYILSQDEALIPNPARVLDEIEINLDPESYSLRERLNERFCTDGIPALVNCEPLTLKGDVVFEKDVIIKGRVAIVNTGQSQAVIKQETVIGRDLML